MRFGILAASTAFVLVAGCGSGGSTETAASPSVEPAPEATASPSTSGTGRVAVDPEAQFVSFRRAAVGTYASDQALITGTLRNLGGCLVVEPGQQVVAFNADYASFDAGTLTLEPIAPGDPVVRVRLGQKVQFGGGYSDFADARTSPLVAVPRACALIAPAEIAYVEDW